MTQRESSAVLEILFVLFCAAMSVAVFRDSLSLPRSLREPLGSATVPQIVCGIVLVFCAVLLVRSVRVVLAERKRRRPEAEPEGRPEGGRPEGGRPEGEATAAGPLPSAPAAEPPKLGLAAAIFAFGLIYVALLEARFIPAFVLTPALLLISFLTLTGFRRSAVLPALLVAGVVGTAVPLIFTEFFSVNLP